MRLIAAALAIIVLVVAGFAVSSVASRGDRGHVSAHRGWNAAPRQGVASPGPSPSPRATPTSADPALVAAIQVGEEFVLDYLDYDYRQGPASGDAIQPYATQRLFWQVTQGGQDTAGNPAPWTAITIGSNEVVTATIVGAEGQVADARDAAVQVVVAEHDTSSGGSWSGGLQDDLGLVLDGGRWLVDQVSEVAAEGSGA